MSSAHGKLCGYAAVQCGKALRLYQNKAPSLTVGVPPLSNAKGNGRTPTVREGVEWTADQRLDRVLTHSLCLTEPLLFCP